ncbi:MAG: hypothetical protein HKM93_02425 [Desulfobacteraceae bacterium]|nr:hypothetical protein [Desulfobacteraceae bacterium]
MIEELIRIADYIGNALLHIWPYLLITIPLSVAVQLSGAANHIRRAFENKPAVSIITATAVGAFSPFCSCGVIPVIASLLISGVPLAPVMSFWIASPSMDPEIFFLSVAMIGWDLAVWRLMAALVLSFAAGVITHLVIRDTVLIHAVSPQNKRTAFSRLRKSVTALWPRINSETGKILSPAGGSQLQTACCGENQSFLPLYTAPSPIGNGYSGEGPTADPVDEKSCGCNTTPPFRTRLVKASVSSTTMVLKFMSLAFLLQALIVLYVPERWIIQLLGSDNSASILIAAVLGVPMYTSNLSALPLVGGLVSQGMQPEAALAFLIAGPTTTLPAMAAVWGLVQRRIFFLYVGFSLLGAVFFGYLYGAVSSLY